MLKTIKRLFADLRLIRMSDGHLALVRDLGLVKGGRGLRQHEKLLSFGVNAASVPAKIRIARSSDLLAETKPTSLGLSS
ncbi:MAG: hypothetical protein HY242_14510 [Afipia sp.]|nr:hypothetical protein [Afipia sp.]